MRRDLRSGKRRISLFAEQLETRQLLAASPSPFTGVFAADVGFAPAVTRAAAFAEPQTSPTATATVVRTGDPLLGYEFTIFNSARAYGYDLMPENRNFIADVPVAGIDIPLAGNLQLRILSGLTYWNGRGTPDFQPVPGTTEINLNVFGQNLRIGRDTDKSRTPQGGFIRRSIDIGTSDVVPLRRTIEASIGSGGSPSGPINSFQKPGGPAGIYAFAALWSIPGASGIRDSVPVSFVFRHGDVPAAALNAAVEALASPRDLPVAVQAVTYETVDSDNPGVPTFMRFYVEFSSPVTSAGRSQQLPILFDQVRRTAQIEPNTNRTDTSTLIFEYVPTRTDLRAIDIRLGDSIKILAGGTLQSSFGKVPILSLPAKIGRQLPPNITTPESPMQVVSADITRNTTWKKGVTYIVDGEVRVQAGVTLTIEEGVQVMIRNGRKPLRTIDTSALIFQSGSRLAAGTFYATAADANNRPVAFADNGGIFFAGGYRDGTKDGISSNTRSGRSRFKAVQIMASYLGRTDPRGGDGNDNDRDDIDGISVIGVGETEWLIEGVQSDFSGDDGFDVFNSSIEMESLIINSPIEDGINNTSSLLTVRRQVAVVMSRTRANDRELFDLEIGKVQPRIYFKQLASVDLRGYWGTRYDEVNLNSPDMPAPPRRGTENQWYEYQGVLKKGKAIIYSIMAD